MITGVYEVVKAMAFVDDKFGLFTKDEVKAYFDKQIAAGEISEAEVEDTMKLFSTRIEFKDNGDVLTWMPTNADNIPEEEIKAAIEAGAIFGYKDGLAAVEKSEWKEVDGVPYFDTKQEIEIAGEKQSSLEEIKFDDDGLMLYGSGSFKLRKID